MIIVKNQVQYCTYISRRSDPDPIKKDPDPDSTKKGFDLDPTKKRIGSVWFRIRKTLFI